MTAIVSKVFRKRWTRTLLHEMRFRELETSYAVLVITSRDKSCNKITQKNRHEPYFHFPPQVKSRIKKQNSDDLWTVRIKTSFGKKACRRFYNRRRKTAQLITREETQLMVIFLCCQKSRLTTNTPITQNNKKIILSLCFEIRRFFFWRLKSARIGARHLLARSKNTFPYHRFNIRW